jgi:hypothetical protein
MLNQARAIKDEIVRLRRDIHQHPELGFQEFRTAQLVADTLAELGIEAQTAIGRTGVVAHIGPGDGPTIGIRADMDALLIRQKNDVPFRSQNEGVMHADRPSSAWVRLVLEPHLTSFPMRFIFREPFAPVMRRHAVSWQPRSSEP